MITKFNDYDKIILETLKSDEIDTVEKKLDIFFKKLGFNKKISFGTEVKSPYYQVFSDRKYLKDELNKYSDVNDEYVKTLSEKDRRMMVKSFKKSLKTFKYGDIFIITDKNTPEITEQLLHLIDTVGYFVSVLTMDTKDDKPTKLEDKTKIKETLKSQNRISLMIEPNFDTKVNFKNIYLYHTTDRKNLDKIMKYGLMPKSKNTRSFYPERIYLSPNRKWMESIKSQLSIDKAADYVDLRITNFKGLSLYKDVRFKGGFYTLDAIHPNYIKVLG
jgi:hypothetical protein